MELTMTEFGAEKQKGYDLLAAMAKALIEGEPHPLANLANLAALLGEMLPDINWAGFYLMNRGELLLGPFWGKPACLHIALGRGVCGTAAASGKVQRVEDVHAFPGHIACDAASASEIVLPLYAGEKLLGVLDIDSPVKARFTEEDEAGLAKFAALVEQSSDWSLCGYTL